jgi:hypothetical protein
MIIVMWSGCKNSVVEILLPDIRGIWDWIINFTINTCSTNISEEGSAVITQDDLDSETTAGTVKIYNKSDENLTCPVWTFHYTMDSNGKMTIVETGVPYDPQECSNSASPDAKGDIQISLDATASQITGTLKFTLYSSSQGWSCEQEGNITFSNKR